MITYGLLVLAALGAGLNLIGTAGQLQQAEQPTAFMHRGWFKTYRASWAAVKEVFRALLHKKTTDMNDLPTPSGFTLACLSLRFTGSFVAFGAIIVNAFIAGAH